MSETHRYIHRLFAQGGTEVPKQRLPLLEAFAADEKTIALAAQILENEKTLMKNWQLLNRINDIKQQPLMIPNGTVGKPYEAKIDFVKQGWADVVLSGFEGLEAVGLSYNNELETISGTPSQSGDVKIVLQFRISGEADDAALNQKIIPLIINPDPKSLWKSADSDKTDPYWKPDDEAAFAALGSKHIVVASKRGRSHANVGGFRDDDFAFQHFADSGWSLVAVADGAGSAKFARKGSALACSAVVDYFTERFAAGLAATFDEVITGYKAGTDAEAQKKLSVAVYENLSKAAHTAHQRIADFAKEAAAVSKDFYSTLIFTLFKKYDFGIALLSFGVGDCPIAFLAAGGTEVTLLNWLDVGEFGGGTRFINMPEIFTSDKFTTRFTFKLVDDFSYLFLMTDGIYDPKFVVEAALEKVEKWNEFLADLQGKNDDGAAVELSAENTNIASQLSTWMDFWSPGNHDDRTLAIIF